MRVLAVTNAYPSAKRPYEATFLKAQVEALRSRGIEVEVLVFDRVGEGMRVYAGVRRGVRAAAGRFRPDLVHTLYGGILAGLVATVRVSIPRVVTFHGSDLKGQPLSGFLRRQLAGAGVRASRFAARRADGVVVVADHLRARLPEDLDPSRIRTIPCGVDLDLFRPLDSAECRSRLGWAPGRFHVLFVWNNADPIKRPELARAAVERLSAGGVPAEIHVMQGVPHDDVPVWLNASHAVLLTSQSEGSPTIVKEALACNRPVVSVGVGDVAEQLRGIGGCHLTEASAQDLARALREVHASSAAVQGRERAERFSQDASAARLADFYGDVSRLRAPRPLAASRALPGGRHESAASGVAGGRAMTAEQLPTVTVVMPVRNEASYIRRSLGGVLAQDYPHELMQVIVADGLSEDGTADAVRALAREGSNLPIEIVDNPGRIVATGLNAAIRLARGEVIVRIDGHCEIPADYVRQCVRALASGEADGVGGSVETVGETPAAGAIALAMSSRFGVGNSAFRTSVGTTRYADTVPFPAYRREVIERLGPYDEELVRNQDDEYNYRLRALGARLLLSADVRSRYYSRSSLRGLWRQYFQYGYWKVRVLQKHPRQMQPRQFAPPAFVLALIVSLAASAVSAPARWGAAALIGTYLAANLGSALVSSRGLPMGQRLRVPLAYGILHFAYGSGFLFGLVHFRNRWGDRSAKAASGATPAKDWGGVIRS